MTHTMAAPSNNLAGAAFKIRSGYFIFSAEKRGNEEGQGVITILDMLGIYDDKTGLAPNFMVMTALKDLEGVICFDSKRQARMVSRMINKQTPFYTMVGLRIWHNGMRQYLPIYRGYGYLWISKFLLWTTTLNFKLWKRK